MVSEFESYPAGTTPPAVSEVIEKLVRRSKVLELVVDGGATKRSLTSEISASRTTIYRSLDQFQEEGLVEENGTEYQVTVLGELLYEEYAEFTATVEAVLGAKCALTKGVEVEVPTDVFLQASVTTASVHGPFGTFEEFQQAIESASTIRGVCTADVLRSDAVADQILDTEFDICFGKGGLETLRKYGDFSTDANDDVTIRTFAGEFPTFVCFLIDGRELCLLLFGDDGELVAVIQSDHDTAVSWGQGMYESFVDRSSVID
jgi:predicted transcriptional regulator